MSQKNDSTEGGSRDVEAQFQMLGLESGYRGFSSSISHSFVDPEEEQVDICALMCCGTMQRDKNTYVLVGELPPSFLYRFTLVAIPGGILIAALLLIFRSEREYHFYIGESLIGLLLVYAVFRMFRSYRLGKHFRREVLWYKYQADGSVLPTPAEYKDIDEHLHEDYLMGQSPRDLSRAHKCCGCYKTDLMSNDIDAPFPRGICGCIWQLFSMICCGELGCFIQCCGICAVAQESREINQFVPPHRRAVDYLTMQPVLTYYSRILRLREKRTGNVFKHIMSISMLSQMILGTFFFILVALNAYCFASGFSWEYAAIIMGSFSVSVLITFLAHWPFNKMKISFDLVVKMFGSGFWIASVMAFFFEGLIWVLVEGGIFVYTTIEEHYGGSANAGDDLSYDAAVDNAAASYIQLGTGANSEFWDQYPIMYLIYLFVQCFFVAAFIEELMKYLAFRMLADHPDFWSTSYLEKVIAGYGIEKHPLVNLFSLVPVKPEHQDLPLRKRSSTIMVAMIAVSLGYACCENLAYVLFYGSKTLDYNFLISRAFALPIHPICAVWQAIGICRRDLEKRQKFQIGMILFPAIFWHGLFDFSTLGLKFVLESGMVDTSQLVDVGIDNTDIEIIVPFVILIFSVLLVICRHTSMQLRLFSIDVEIEQEKKDAASEVPLSRDLDKAVFTTFSFNVCPQTSFSDISGVELTQGGSRDVELAEGDGKDSEVAPNGSKDGEKNEGVETTTKDVDAEAVEKKGSPTPESNGDVSTGAIGATIQWSESQKDSPPEIETVMSDPMVEEHDEGADVSASVDSHMESGLNSSKVSLEPIGEGVNDTLGTVATIQWSESQTGSAPEIETVISAPLCKESPESIGDISNGDAITVSSDASVHTNVDCNSPVELDIETTMNEQSVINKDAEEFSGVGIISSVGRAYNWQESDRPPEYDLETMDKQIAPESKGDISSGDVSNGDLVSPAAVPNVHTSVESDSHLGIIPKTETGDVSNGIMNSAERSYPWHEPGCPMETVLETSMDVSVTMSQDAQSSDAVAAVAGASAVPPEVAAVQPEAKQESIYDILKRIRSNRSGSLPLPKDDKAQESGNPDEAALSTKLSAKQVASSTKSRLEIILGELAAPETTETEQTSQGSNGGISSGDISSGDLVSSATVPSVHASVASDSHMASIPETQAGDVSNGIMNSAERSYPSHESDYPMGTVQETRMDVSITVSENAQSDDAIAVAGTSAVQPEAVAVQPEAATVQPEAAAVQPEADVQPEAKREGIDDLLNRLRSNSSGSLPLPNDDDEQESGNPHDALESSRRSTKSRLEIILGKLAADDAAADDAADDAAADDAAADEE